MDLNEILSALDRSSDGFVGFNSETRWIGNLREERVLDATKVVVCGLQIAFAHGKLLAGAVACNWRKRSFELFQDIDILVRDTGMCNERELCRMRIENLDWKIVIFVPDSKTPKGRRRVPMSNRAHDVPAKRCTGREEGWVFPSKRAK